MENKLSILQTETMIALDYNGQSYSIILTEDKDPNSGCTSWEIYNDDGDSIVDDDLESEIISYIIENM
jgi:hypothetical protein